MRQGGLAVLRRWWTRPDHFEWLCGYLSARGLAAATRRSVAMVVVALAGMPIGLLPRRDSVAAIVLTISAVIVGLGYAIVWLRDWPTRRQSLLMITSGGLVAVSTILAAEPLSALISCSGLVILCGYLAFFHSARDVACGMAVALAVSAVCAYRVADELPGSSVAVTGFWVAAEIIVVAPIAIEAVVRTLGADVVRSDRDALTGVLNRRAFYERASRKLTSPPVPGLRLIVVMLDLDHFKPFNDTHGHLAGDQLLTAVGWALRRANSGTAIIGRVGGDEFVVVDCLPPDRADALPPSICAAIAALPHGATTSVGAAVVPFADIDDPMRTIGDLIRLADTAMYQAKRGGGNLAKVAVPHTGRR
ncbi:diguanylate cyclase domain-containing protein [Mycobacterium sp. WMMD1722]|uniref:GGDEF domain-containing protein n=1 Tax=Mycobacterium sp. WMMD1722 TaxID=3404117 RepID=UPI003BF506FF